MNIEKKPSIKEVAEKYAKQFLWLENVRQREGWGDTPETREVLLTNLIEKAFEEREP